MTTKQHQNAPKVHTSHITAVPAAIVTQICSRTSKKIIEMMLIATADEILWKCLKMGGFDVPKRNGTNLKLIVKFKWRRR
jgi:hypothetical protein